MRVAPWGMTEAETAEAKAQGVTVKALCEIMRSNRLAVSQLQSVVGTQAGQIAALAMTVDVHENALRLALKQIEQLERAVGFDRHKPRNPKG